ncbi:MAG: hypothetical protein ABSB10_07450 [Candidatus Bathyarchaeia archaeon]
MVNDEGLRSYKAIAFITSKSNPKRSSLKTKTYLILGALLQKIVLSKQKTLSCFSKNLGEKLWIK